jgi:hypothetical protein
MGMNEREDEIWIENAPYLFLILMNSFVLSRHKNGKQKFHQTAIRLEKTRETTKISVESSMFFSCNGLAHL